MSFKKYEKNIQSQFGEDGVIEEIFNRIGTENKICVEFGAWDGVHLSNAWNLWHNKDWKAILIEGDKEKYQQLEESTKSYKNVIPYLAYVDSAGENALESILNKLALPSDIDLLSIDIDGDDYYIFESLSKFRPRLLIVECNPTIPPDFDIRQEKGEYFGSSALSLLNLGHKKGYKLAHMTDTNIFMVEEKSFDKLAIEEPSLRSIFVNSHLVNIVSAFNGATFMVGKSGYSTFDKTQSNIKFPKLISNNSPIEKIVVYKDTPQPKNKLKHFIKKTFVYKAWLNYKKANLKKKEQKEEMTHWIHNGRPAPPPQLVKRQIIKQYAARYNTKVLLETGTYMGDTIESCRKIFKKIFSIELDSTLFRNASERFKKYKHISILEGDSGITIEKVLSEINEPCLFWLDGHYSDGVTAKGSLNTPILNELEHIFIHPIEGHVILIDDARCFIGKDDYPTIDELKTFVYANKPDLKFSVADDIIRIHR